MPAGRFCLFVFSCFVHCRAPFIFSFGLLIGKGFMKGELIIGIQHVSGAGSLAG